MSGSEKRSGLTRRGFLKATAASCGAATSILGLASCSTTGKGGDLAATGAEEQIYSGCCRPNCEQACHLNIHVREGKIVRTSMAPMPDECYNRICIKGLSHVQRLYGEDRLKYPMRRTGDRGSGEFERISWEEAIELIADKWSQYDDKRSIVYQNGASYSLVNGGNGAVQRLFNSLGTSTIFQCFDVNMVQGFMRSIGCSSTFWNTNEFSTLHNARNIIIWGGNITESQTHDWHFVSEAQEGGTHLTVIDPVFTTAASKADLWLPVRPASDTAMVLAMIKLVIDNDWIDYDFVKSRTGAPFLVKEEDGKFLRMSDLGVEPTVSVGEDGNTISTDQIVVWDSVDSVASPVDTVEEPALFGAFEVNGHAVKTVLTMIKELVEDYTLEVAEEITTISAQTIEEFTQRYALNGPSTIYPLFGPDRYENGVNLAHSLGILACLTGNIGKEGAACGLNTFWQNMSWGTLNSVDESAMSPITGNVICSVAESHELNGEPYPEIKSFCYWSCNSIGNDPDQTRHLKMLDSVDFVVCVDFRMTDTAMASDLVLPAAFWFEVEDAGSFGTHPFIIYQEKAIDPLFEAKSDFEIAKLIAEKMGLSHLYEITPEEYLRKFFEDDPQANKMGITLEALKREKVMRHTPYPAIYGKDGFSHPSGRAELYCENPTQFVPWGNSYDPEEDHLPKFVEPLEAWPTNPLHEKYPFVLLQQHTRWRTHTQWSHVPILRELDPEPVVKICPADADSRGVSNGDYVRVFNDRGTAVAKVVIDASYPSGVIDMPKGWQRDQFIEGGYQELSPYEVTLSTANAIPFDTLVDFEKYEEA